MSVEGTFGAFASQFAIPSELVRRYDVYERIRKLGIELGTQEENLLSLSGRNIALVVFTETGLVFISGSAGGKTAMTDHDDAVWAGQRAGEMAADHQIRWLHWALTCGGEGGDLNDVLYTVKGLGLVVSEPSVHFTRAPAVVNGYSARWHSVFGGAIGAWAVDGEDPGGNSGVHARSALGGLDGGFSQESEMIVTIPAALARAIIAHRGWLYPLPPSILHRLRYEGRDAIVEAG